LYVVYGGEIVILDLAELEKATWRYEMPLVSVCTLSGLKRQREAGANIDVQARRIDGWLLEGKYRCGGKGNSLFAGLWRFSDEEVNHNVA